MPGNQRSQDHLVFSINYGFEIDRTGVASLTCEITFFIHNISYAATHAGREIASAGAKHDYQTVGHVFAAVIADTFNDCCRSRVSDRETFPGYAVEESFTTGGTVKRHIPYNDILFGQEH